MIEMKIKRVKGTAAGVELAIERDDAVRVFIAQDETDETRAKGTHRGWISDGRVAVRMDCVRQIRWGNLKKDNPGVYRQAIEFEATGDIADIQTIVVDDKFLEADDLVDLEITHMTYRQMDDINLRVCIQKVGGEVIGLRTVAMKYDLLLTLGERVKMDRGGSGRIFVYSDETDGPVAVVMPVTIGDYERSYLEKEASEILKGIRG
jgi:hypothetical protein